MEKIENKLEGEKILQKDLVNYGTSTEPVELERSIGLLSAISIVLGIIVGTGIFIQPAGVVQYSGSVGESLIIWFLCGIFSLVGALCYVELGTQINESGSEYIYLHHAFVEGDQSVTQNKWARFPAFLYQWVAILIAKPSFVGVVAMVFGEYFIQLFTTRKMIWITKLIAIILISLLTLINSVSMKLVEHFQNITTIIKMFAVLTVIIGGGVLIIKGHTEILQSGFTNSTMDGLQLSVALSNGLWAYDGWNNLNMIVGELKEPQRTLPIALIIGLPIVILIFMLMNVSYFTLFTPSEIMKLDIIGVAWANKILGEKMGWLMPLFICISAIGSCNATILGNSRIVYISATKGDMISLFGMIHVKFRTPLPAIILQSSITVLMILLTDLNDMIQLAMFTMWIFYGLTFFCIIWMRWTKPEETRPFKIPLILPIIAVFFSIFIVGGPLIYNPNVSHLISILIMLSSLTAFIPFIIWEKRISCFEKVTNILKNLFQLEFPHS
ncbi:hypothetical protein SNEBB_004414 [Seison nebaliae]|nr:hypothetical protein SNEBB_004414 [Seison nebaliae]